MSKTHSLTTESNYPVWLALLIAGQWLSARVALVTALGALLAYALTVNTNRRLTVAAATLEHLQAQQQQLTAANAVFKSHLAQTVSMALESNALHPKDVIFLEASEVSSTEEVMPKSVPADSVPSKQRLFPKGY